MQNNGAAWRDACKSSHHSTLGVLDILEPQDLRDILNFTARAAPKWREIGTQLSVPHHHIAGNQRPIQSYSELLECWLKQAPPNHDLPTVRALAEALRSEPVGEERLAFELEKKWTGGKIIDGVWILYFTLVVVAFLG